MRQNIRTAFVVVLTGFVGLSCVAFAQETSNDVLIFDNQTDFLLPSYFDAPPSTPESSQVSIGSEQQPLPTQNVPTDIDILTEIFGDQAASKQAVEDTSSLPPQKPRIQTTTQTFYPTPKSVRKTELVPLLTPLPPLPKLPEPSVTPTKRMQYSSPYATKLLAKESGKTKINVQLPKEIRLEFTANSTQLTNSAVKWVSAYALHVQKNPTQVVSLRVSYQNWAVQQARLGIIMQIMMEKGLPVRQIRIYQSDRNPDTLVIGADDNPELTHAITSEDVKKVNKEQKVLSW